MSRKLISIFSVVVMVVTVFASAVPVSAVDYPTNMISWWKMENDFVDSQGGNHGTGYGGVGFEGGKIGITASFDGADDYIDCGNGGGLDITGSITIEAWIYAESFGSGSSPNDQRIIACKWGDTHYGTAGYALLTVDSSLRFIVSSSGSNVKSVSGSIMLETQQWYHVVGIYDGTYLRVYVNGNSDGINNIGSISIYNTPASFKIGAYDTHWGWIAHWDGNIDEVAVYDKALDDNEIDYRYQLDLSKPIADAGIDQMVGTAEEVTFDGSNSIDIDGTIVKYEWDFDDDGIYDYGETSNSAPDGAFDGITTHMYASQGVYTVTLRVTDNDLLTETDTCVITVSDQDSLISVDPMAIDFGKLTTRSSKTEIITIANIGSEDLEIHSISLKEWLNYSFEPEIKRKGKVLAPGEELEIQVTLRPYIEGFVENIYEIKGFANDILEIHSNDPVYNLIEVELSGEIEIHEIDKIIHYYKEEIEHETIHGLDPRRPEVDEIEILTKLQHAALHISLNSQKNTEIAVETLENIFELSDEQEYVKDILGGIFVDAFAGKVLELLISLGQSTDFDKDGLTFIEEAQHMTNPRDKDTDKDDLSDFEEVNDGDDGYVTDPLKPDTDEDGLSDGDEKDHKTNPLEKDTDFDGTEDPDEINLLRDPTIPAYHIRGKVATFKGGNFINLKHLQIQYAEYDGHKWLRVFTNFTDADGKFDILTDYTIMTEGRHGKLIYTLIYSSTRDARDIDIMCYYDDYRRPFSKELSLGFLRKNQDYVGDMVFEYKVEGGITYSTAVKVVEYFGRDEDLEVRFMDDDYKKKTSYQKGNLLSIWHTHTGYECIVGHEYAHREAANFAGAPLGDDIVGENWANFGSCIARGTPIHDLGGGLCVPDISVDADTGAGEKWFNLSGVMWDLDHQLVRDTLANGVHKTDVEDFYNKYRVLDNNLTDAQIKQIFRNHGFNTAGWA